MIRTSSPETSKEILCYHFSTSNTLIIIYKCLIINLKNYIFPLLLFFSVFIGFSSLFIFLIAFFYQLNSIFLFYNTIFKNIFLTKHSNNKVLINYYFKIIKAQL